MAEECRGLLIRSCREAMEIDGAEVLILAGGILAGPFPHQTQPPGQSRRARPLAGYGPEITGHHVGAVSR
jgi:hypothetical protein